mmetsp:Transcript_22888/g.33482  ORF Transcript_22888/g.33482 Transcript_22888/m.33482 type:complete len:339 (-) Transcript_22888:438-1454(-)|eukprot:CAMPEP_0195510920 /NCGR_PEP_ID=MMETSP0794_2-20130614/3416_1 /TAXON_ID=515487 /ORGANISM="Stephanopyxis turris, Strain CCMP 815" /LENGTH=338 /DNA_ID=CAMNT_0040638431 /DNA_START=63 /DNA_END=1079 /DNA_ORIENTATION=-
MTIPDTITSATPISAPNAALARKRRLQKMRSSSASNSAVVASSKLDPKTNVIAAAADDILPHKKRRVSEVLDSNTGKSQRKTPNAKNPPQIKSKPSNTKPKKSQTQMRYDPDVPMTKEQAAIWRREARRVRNRESAAASRQKTRNRIAELELELEEWKAKYNKAIDKIKHLESMSPTHIDQDQTQSQQPRPATPLPDNTQSFQSLTQNNGNSNQQGMVSPPSTPPMSPVSSHPDVLPLPVSSSLLIKSNDRNLESVKVEEKKQHLNETISRPAVKITGAASSSPDKIPDSCSADSSKTTGTVNGATAQVVLPSGAVCECPLFDGEELDELLFDALSGL